MKILCPKCRASSFSSWEKATAGRWNKKRCKSCGAIVFLHPIWSGLLGGVSSLLLVGAMLAGLLLGSWKAFLIIGFAVLMLVVVAGRFIPLVYKDGDKGPG